MAAVSGSIQSSGCGKHVRRSRRRTLPKVIPEQVEAMPIEELRMVVRKQQQRGWWSEAAAASILSRKVHEVCNNIRKSTVKAPFITPASKITSRRTSTTSLDSEMKQLGRKSPLKVTEDELPPVVQCYFELGVKRRDWQSHCNHASRSSASGSFRR